MPHVIVGQSNRFMAGIVDVGIEGSIKLCKSGERFHSGCTSALWAALSGRQPG
jgi:hypothetical protein